MNFKFKLEAVRKQRRRVVDALSRDLAEAETRIGLIQERLATLDEDIHSQMAPAGSGSSHQIQVADLIAKTAWLDHLRRLRQHFLL